jgi:hypothetical protein
MLSLFSFPECEGRETEGLEGVSQFCAPIADQSKGFYLSLQNYALKLCSLTPVSEYFTFICL